MNNVPASGTVLCAGRIYCDLVFTGAPDLPKMGTETFAKDLSLHTGGGAFITSAAFSALGWQAALLTTLPAAPFDTVVRADIAKLGINIDLSTAADADASPQISVAIAGPEDRAFLTNTSGNALPGTDIPSQKFCHLHIGELRSLVEHPELVKSAKAAAMTISVDCGWDDDVLAQGSKMTDVLRDIDVFLPNDTEFERLTASGMAQNACALTVVKCGSAGARALREGQWINQPTTKADIVDATGAGDAFNGGFLSGWLRGEDLLHSMRNGNRCGRASVEHVGGTAGLSTLTSGTQSFDAAE